jgi:hypothetical protein
MSSLKQSFKLVEISECERKNNTPSGMFYAEWGYLQFFFHLNPSGFFLYQLFCQIVGDAFNGQFGTDNGHG